MTDEEIKKKVWETGEGHGHVFEETKESESDWTAVKCNICGISLYNLIVYSMWKERS